MFGHKALMVYNTVVVLGKATASRIAKDSKCDIKTTKKYLAMFVANEWIEAEVNQYRPNVKSKLYSIIGGM